MPDVVQLEYLPEANHAEVEIYYQKLMLGFQAYVESLKNYLKEERRLNRSKM
jgi:exodeoxyribonuclease V alpha subunit